MAKNILRIREDCWPDDDENPGERYLYVSGSCVDTGNTRIEILESGVMCDDTCIIFKSQKVLDEWISILRRAWKIKTDQDKKGWLQDY